MSYSCISYITRSLFHLQRAVVTESVVHCDVTVFSPSPVRFGISLYTMYNEWRSGLSCFAHSKPEIRLGRRYVYPRKNQANSPIPA
jgi:hypothetical protein